MKFFKLIPSVLIFIVLLTPTFAIAQDGNTHVPTRTTDSNSNSNNSSHAASHPIPNPANLTFNKGLAKAREIVASKTEFKTVANTSNPLFIWGDRGYSIQNSLQLHSIIEYNDSNNNLVFDPNESVKQLDFQNHASWNFSQEDVNNTYVVFTLYTHSINQTGFEKTQVNLTQYMSSANNYMKFDIIISNWNWTSVNDRLAFSFNFALTGVLANSHIQISSKTNISNDNSTDDGIFIKNGSNQTIGYVLSSNLAMGGLANKIFSVKNQFQIEHNNNTAFIVLNYPYFGTYLRQDPIIGSNGDTVTLLTQLYSIMIDRQGLLSITIFLSLVSLMAIVIMRRRY